MTRLKNRDTGTIVHADGDLETKLLASGYRPADEPDDEDGPPRGNAGRDAWAEYADSLGVEYAEDAGREDIKAAVAAAASPDL